MFFCGLLPFGERLDYVAYDPESGRSGLFRFKIKKVDGCFRAYIKQMPPLGGRDASMHKIHVLRDCGKVYVCVINKIYTAEKMRAVARLWARKYLRYVALGKLYEEK